MKEKLLGGRQNRLQCWQHCNLSNEKYSASGNLQNIELLETFIMVSF